MTNQRPVEKLQDFGGDLVTAEQLARARKDIAVEEPVDVSAMTPDELRELLQEEGAMVSDEQAALLMKLISELGGIDNAQSVLAQMISQNRAA
jgi:DNA-directed RNA polymerase subunit F